jgi:hypothetical protein
MQTAIAHFLREPMLNHQLAEMRVAPFLEMVDVGGDFRLGHRALPFECLCHPASFLSPLSPTWLALRGKHLGRIARSPHPALNSKSEHAASAGTRQQRCRQTGTPSRGEIA